VTNPEPSTFAELIADCADIPDALRAPDQDLPSPRATTSWAIDDTCHAQVRGLEEYV